MARKYNRKYLQKLAKKIIEGHASPEEKFFLDEYYNAFDKEPGVSSVFSETELTSIKNQVQESLHLHMEGRRNVVIPIYRRFMPRIAAAAAIIFFLLLGYYLHIDKPKATLQFTLDIAPGTNKAFITLANGQKVPLESIHNKRLAKQGSVSIRQNEKGEVIYKATATQYDHAPLNTLTNPRGGKVVSLELSDGTKLRLDASSSVTYPTFFSGKSRNISTTGRVYLAVTYHKDQPFYSTANGQVVKDLGTQFVVEAYDDESLVKTTLIEGSVEVSKNGEKVLLKPGKQSLVDVTNQSIAIKAADMDIETAWLSDDFEFHSQDLGSIMRQIARVYDIEVVYRDKVSQLRFDGIVSRSRNISAVLGLMESTGKIHFKIDGRRVTITENK